MTTLALTIEARDAYTEGHCRRVAAFAVALGKRIALDEDHLESIRLGALLHDLGKVSVPESILLKPGPLTPDEWDVMRRHPEVGEMICRPLSALALARLVIRHHHERMDGSGYPDGLRGEAIPFGARILSIVDVFDALTTDRPYRPALSLEEALQVLLKETQAGWWDKRLLDEFIGLLQSCPLPTLSIAPPLAS